MIVRQGERFNNDVFSDRVESTCIAWVLSIAALMEMIITRYNRYDSPHLQTSHWVHNLTAGPRILHVHRSQSGGAFRCENASCASMIYICTKPKYEDK